MELKFRQQIVSKFLAHQSRMLKWIFPFTWRLASFHIYHKVSIIRVYCWYFTCLHRTIIWSVICVVIGWLVSRRITIKFMPLKFRPQIVSKFIANQSWKHLDSPYLIHTLIMEGTCHSEMCHLTLTSFAWSTDFKIFVTFSWLSHTETRGPCKLCDETQITLWWTKYGETDLITKT
jgi:hypothetical protein